jgi:hypothetical protein
LKYSRIFASFHSPDYLECLGIELSLPTMRTPNPIDDGLVEEPALRKWNFIDHLAPPASTTQCSSATSIVQLIPQIERSRRRDQRASDENERRQLRNIAEEVNREIVAVPCDRRAVRPHSEQHGGIEDKIVARVIRLAHTPIVGCR